MGLKDQCPIRIDLGLFEWLIWYPEEFPEWCSTEELNAAGYNIDTDYKSMYTMDDLIEGRGEDLDQFYLRNHDVVQRTLTIESELLQIQARRIFVRKFFLSCGRQILAFKLHVRWQKFFKQSFKI